MNPMRTTCIFVVLALSAGASGCKDSSATAADGSELAKAKVAAMKNLASAMAKDANSPDIFEALEGFRNVFVDMSNYPAEAREILDIYKREIEGKYKGQNAQQVQQEMLAFRNQVGIK